MDHAAWRHEHNGQIEAYWKNQSVLNDKNEKAITFLRESVSLMLEASRRDTESAQRTLKIVGALGPAFGVALAFVLQNFA